MSQQYGQIPDPADPYRVQGSWQDATTGSATPYGQTPPPGGPDTGYGYGYGYGATGGYQSLGYTPPQPTNTLAIVSLVTSILGLGLVGIVTGHIARSQIRRTGQGGAGVALAGLIIGYIVTALEIAFILFVIGLVAVSQSGSSF